MGFAFTEGLFREALGMHDRAAADAWADRTVWQLAEAECVSLAVASERVRAALGVWASLYGLDAMRAVWRLYEAPHPVLGSPEALLSLSPEALIELGGVLAEQRGAIGARLDEATRLAIRRDNGVGRRR